MAITLTSVKLINFEDIQPGQTFYYRSSGPILKRNTFVKLEARDTEPNARGILSDKLKLWFQPDATVMINKEIEDYTAEEYLAAVR